MTQTTFTDNVLVDGSQDIKQLRVQGHTTQVQPIQTWEDSAGGTLAQLTGDGRLIVGDDVTPDSLIEAHRLETSTSKPKRGLHSVGRVSGVLATLVQWMVGELELRGSNAIDALHTGLRIRAANMNTGTPTANAELRAADVEVINDATAGAAALPKATGLQVAVTNASGKLITDAAALRLKVNNAGTITNSYAIFSEGPGITHLEDFIELKVPVAGVPGPSLVSNVMRLYPKSDGKLYAKNWIGGGQEFDLTGGSGGGGTPVAMVCDGRLTLASRNPIPVADITAATTLYFTPLRGTQALDVAQIALFNGTSWVLYSFTERSLSLSGLLANTMYDIFLYDNAGTLTLEAVAWNAPTTGNITSIASTAGRRVTTPVAHGLTTGQLVTISGNSVASNNATWRVSFFSTTQFDLLNLNGTTSSATGTVGNGGSWQRADQNTARAVSLVIQDGVYVKSGATARRYLGTIRITGVAGQSEDSEKKRYIYNEYNQVSRKVKAAETVSSWTYVTNAWRAANNNLANRVEVVMGNTGSLADFDLMARISAGGPGVVHGFGLDVINASIADLYPNVDTNSHVSAHLVHNPAVGYHFYQWVENGRASASGTVFGSSANVYQSGFVGEITL